MSSSSYSCTVMQSSSVQSAGLRRVGGASAARMLKPRGAFNLFAAMSIVRAQSKSSRLKTRVPRFGTAAPATETAAAAAAAAPSALPSTATARRARTLPVDGSASASKRNRLPITNSVGTSKSAQCKNTSGAPPSGATKPKPLPSMSFRNVPVTSCSFQAACPALACCAVGATATEDEGETAAPRPVSAFCCRKSMLSSESGLSEHGAAAAFFAFATATRAGSSCCCLQSWEGAGAASCEDARATVGAGGGSCCCCCGSLCCKNSCCKSSSLRKALRAALGSSGSAASCGGRGRRAFSSTVTSGSFGASSGNARTAPGNTTSSSDANVAELRRLSKLLRKASRERKPEAGGEARASVAPAPPASVACGRASAAFLSSELCS
mmetsp:Transcript_56175/g.182302  ORF Transcript_56175/g.182302 Transcript_56175/m.182302 type:complete len:381 (-) Transcript_56175:124-1266(-)